MSTKNKCDRCANFKKCGARNVSKAVTVTDCSGFSPSDPNEKYNVSILRRIMEVVE